MVVAVKLPAELDCTAELDCFAGWIVLHWLSLWTICWRHDQVTEHGGSWKQLYFERNLEEALEK